MHSHPKAAQRLRERLPLVGYPLYSHYFDWQVIIFPLSHPLISDAIFCSLQKHLFPVGQRQPALCCRFIFIPMCYSAWHWGSETILFTASPIVQIIMSLRESALSVSIHLFKYIPKPAGCTEEICVYNKNVVLPPLEGASTAVNNSQPLNAISMQENGKLHIPQTQVHFPAAKINYSHMHDREHLKQTRSCECSIKTISTECSIQHTMSL